MKIPVGISARHCHLTEETYIKLFGNNQIEKLKDLNQPGEYATTSTITIRAGESEINSVRVLAPFRSYDQVEISKTDAYALKINPPVRKSGDTKESSPITLVGPKSEIDLSEGCIIANRHIHLNSDEATELGLIEDQIVNIKINSEKKGIIEAYVKIINPSIPELHLDVDDGNAFLLSNGDEVELG